MTKKIILASLVVLGSVELSAYTYEVSPLIGKNFTEDHALVKDSTAFGIRLNKYISEDNAIMFGYTRINGADYKKSNFLNKNIRSTSACNTAPCKSTSNDWSDDDNYWDDDDSSCNATTNCGSSENMGTDNTAGNANSGNVNSGNANSGNANSGNANAGNANSGNANAGNTAGNANTPTKTKTKKLSHARYQDTDINRFYINGLHNIKTQYSRLVPYVYGGFGYEHVENEFSDNDSQGFFNAGGGLKFKVNDRFSLISDIQGVKKFNSHDFDILGSVGIGYLFGSLLQPEPEAVVDSGLEDVQPTPEKREITVIKVAPKPLEVAPIVADVPSGEYYVQIAAGFNTDMETGCKHTRDLRKAGIDYDIKYTTIKGKNAALVVVGPFETKEEAKAQLPKLRKFSKDAFVKRIKN